jgi:hypothetical protein
MAISSIIYLSFQYWYLAATVIPCNLSWDSSDQVGTQNFLLGGGVGADPEAVYNLCLILKIVL